MRKLKFVPILIAIAFVLGCTHTITWKGTLAGMYQIYNDQYENYQSLANNPNTTEAQKEVMRQKKPILDKLGKLLPAYDSAIVTGTATSSQRKTIMDLLDELGRL